MSRSQEERLEDILNAVGRCRNYRARLNSLDAEVASMAYDAILRNLAVIGEAARALPEPIRASMPTVPWAAIIGLRNVIVHEYFRLHPALIIDIVDSQLVPLSEAITAL